jgi:Flp pilus assembly protein TadG
MIGFLGLVIDVGRLFVTKTELQSALDACALAAAAELRPGVSPPDTQAVNRAVSAALTTANRNKVVFQANSAAISAADIYFSDRLSNNTTTFPSVTDRVLQPTRPRQST